MELDRITSKSVQVFRKYGVIRASLFGSYARNEQRAHSDVDFLIELPRTRTGLDFIGYYSELKSDLERAIGKPVDLVQYHLIKTSLKTRITAEALPVYAQ